MANETEPLSMQEVRQAAEALANQLADQLRVPFMDQRLDNIFMGLASPETRERLVVLGTLHWVLNKDTTAAGNVTVIVSNAISTALLGGIVKRHKRARAWDSRRGGF